MVQRHFGASSWPKQHAEGPELDCYTGADPTAELKEPPKHVSVMPRIFEFERDSGLNLSQTEAHISAAARYPYYHYSATK